MAGPDAADPYSRARPLEARRRLRQRHASRRADRGPAGVLRRPRFGGSLRSGDRAGRGARRSRSSRSTSSRSTRPRGCSTKGPGWRSATSCSKSLLASSPESIHPVTREIIVQGARPSAVDTFAAFYKLEELRRVRDVMFRSVDALLLPTAPTAYTVKQVLADPIQLNSRLGTYTNFVNLLDLCGLAVPASMRDDGIPFGVTLLAPGGHDGLLASIGRAFHADTGLPMGALKRPQPPLATAVGRARGGRDRHRRGRRASVRHAAQRRAQGAGRAPARRDIHRARLPALCACGEQSAEARAASRRAGAGQRHRGRNLGVARRRLRPVCRRRFRSPMSIGTLRLADGRIGQGISGRGGCGCGRARIFPSFGGWRNYLARNKAAAG